MAVVVVVGDVGLPELGPGGDPVGELAQLELVEVSLREPGQEVVGEAERGGRAVGRAAEVGPGR